MRSYLLSAVLAAAALLPRPAAAQLPLLEKYTLESLGEQRGLVYDLYDQSFGGGDAQGRIQLRRQGSSRTLYLRVWRRVRAGHTSFALLGERVEVRGFDVEGSVIFSRDFTGLTEEGIYFGDGSSGTWLRTLREIPPAVRKLEVTFLGNYE